MIEGEHLELRRLLAGRHAKVLERIDRLVEPSQDLSRRSKNLTLSLLQGSTHEALEVLAFIR
jgi:hypothetical protein